MRYKMKVVKKPWGREIWFALTKHYIGKFIIIKKGYRLSKQYHRFKHESFYTKKGRYLLEFNGKRYVVKAGTVVTIPPGTVHRIEAKFGDVEIIEVSTPQYKDIVRLEDDFGRAKKRR